jgi:hypothetical protein
MSALFDLVGEYKELYAMLTDTDEGDEEIVETSLESVQFEIDKKAEGYLSVIEKLDMELAAAEKQKEFWTKVVSTRKNGKQWMLQHLTDAMIMMGVDEIQAGAKKFKLVNNGGKLPLVLEENKEIPQSYMKVILEPDKEKIRCDLENGKELEFAHIGQRGKHISIRG